MKIRLSKSLKNNEIAFSNATERDEISLHYYAITMHGFLKVQTKDLFGLISDYVNIIRLGKINRPSFFKIKIKTVYDYMFIEVYFLWLN